MVADTIGKYEIRDEIGRGAMGVVYRAFDTVLERDVALKTMALPDGRSNEEDILRFLREARAAGKLRHPNIVTIYELGEETGTPYIAMELMQGHDLRARFVDILDRPISERVELVAQLCDGLHFAHEAGIVHRDIKPANLFLLEGGGLKILDFGVAKITASDATRTGLVLGTVDYMSPEQVCAERNLDGRSDLFSAGVILYELLFGQRPFSGDHVGTTLHRILNSPPAGATHFERILPPDLLGTLNRALEKKRGERFENAAEMAASLRACLPSVDGAAGESLRSKIVAATQQGCFAAVTIGADARIALPETALSTAVSSPPLVEAEPPQTRRSNIPVIVAISILLAGLALAAFALLPKGESSAPDQVAALPAAPARQDPVESEMSNDAVQDEVNVTNTKPERPTEKAPLETTQLADSAIVEPRSVRVATKTEPAPPALPGRLDLLVLPWARVTSIQNIDDQQKRFDSGQVTPTSLELPPGAYRIELAHPSQAQPIVVEANVASQERAIVRRRVAAAGFMNWIERQLARESIELEASQ